MKRTVKKVLSLLLVVIMLLVCMGTYTSFAVSINDPEVFLKQPSGSGYCTLTSATMMLRRRAIIDGNSSWSSITNDAIYSTAWIYGQGLRYSFTYSGYSVKHTSLGSSKKSGLIGLLSTYIEGIIVYNTSVPHAVLLTDYDSSTDTFYCADPANGVATGRITLNDCSLPGSTQDAVISGISEYWYISNIHTHNYNMLSYYQSAHPHYAVYKCSCGAEQVNYNETHHSASCDTCIANLKAPTLAINKTTAVVGESITITWPDDTGANSYWVNVFYNGETVKDGYADSRTSYTFTANKEGTYGFSVIALIDENIGKHSAVWINYIPELKAPALSVDKTTAVVGESVTITWPDDTGADRYWVNVFYNGEIIKDGYSDTRTSYTFTASKEGAYGFSVIAISDEFADMNSVVWVNYINNFVLDNWKCQ